MKWLFLTVSILSEVIATTALKSSNGFTKLVPSLIVIIGYGLAFYFLSLTLKYIPIGIVYAIWSGVGIVLIALIGFLIFKQSLDIPAYLGLFFITIGILIMNIFLNRYNINGLIKINVAAGKKLRSMLRGNL